MYDPPAYCGQAGGWALGVSLWGRTPQAEWAQLWLSAHLEYSGLEFVSVFALCLCGVHNAGPLCRLHIPTLGQPPRPNLVPLPSLALVMGHHRILSVSVFVQELVTLL